MFIQFLSTYPPYLSVQIPLTFLTPFIDLILLAHIVETTSSCPFALVFPQQFSIVSARTFATTSDDSGQNPKAVS